MNRRRSLKLNVLKKVSPFNLIGIKKVLNIAKKLKTVNRITHTEGKRNKIRTIYRNKPSLT